MRTMIILMLLGATGCALQSGDTGGEDTDAFNPTTGIWHATSDEQSSNTCDFESDDDSAYDTFNVTMVDEDTFAMELADATDSEGTTFTCDLTDKSFSCEDEETEETWSEDGFEIVLAGTHEVSGSFDSKESLELTYTVGVECSGDDCAALSHSMTFPCEIVGDVAATAG